MRMIDQTAAPVPIRDLRLARPRRAPPARSATWSCAARAPSAPRAATAWRRPRWRRPRTGFAAYVAEAAAAAAGHAAHGAEPLLRGRPGARAPSAEPALRRVAGRRPRGGACARPRRVAREDTEACRRIGEIGAALIRDGVPDPHALQRRLARLRRTGARRSRRSTAPKATGSGSPSGSTRPGPGCRARASPRGSWRERASTSASSPTTRRAFSCAGARSTSSSWGRTGSRRTATWRTRSAPTRRRCCARDERRAVLRRGRRSPPSTRLPDGDDIPIEERGRGGGAARRAGPMTDGAMRTVRLAAPGAGRATRLRRDARRLVTGIITERGIVRPQRARGSRRGLLARLPGA